MRKYSKMLTTGAAIFAFALLTAASIRLFTSRKSCPPDCNVILISIDSLNARNLELYGYNRETSPNLTKWAQDGFVFENYITAGKMTPISEMAVHTGRYPSSNGLVDGFTGIFPGIPTLAEILKAQGYKTIALGSSAEFYVPGHMSDATQDSFRRGFDSYYEDFERASTTIKYFPQSGSISSWRDYSWPKLTRGLPFPVLNRLSQLRKDRFFLWLSVGTAHWPYQAEKPFQFADRAYNGFLRKDDLHGRTKLLRIFRGTYYPVAENEESAPVSPQDLQFIRDRYDDGIFLVDQFLGELFAALRKNGLEKNSIIVLQSEHGEEMAEHGYFAHYDVFDTQVNTPLVMKVPAMQARRITDQVSGVDLLPTLLELLRIPTPAGINGSSFLSLLKDPRAKFRPHTLIERTPLLSRGMTGVPAENMKPEEYARNQEFLKVDREKHFRELAVRTNEWKLIEREDKNIHQRYDWWSFISKQTIDVAPYELYDLKNDPGETINVVDRYPDVTENMKELLVEWKNKIGGNRPPDALETTPQKLQPYF